jgi:DNA-binding transcriptional ArsR family regulator
MERHTISTTPHPTDLASVTKTFKALSDPTRARLILLLAEGERTVTELVEALHSPQSTVSRHLAVLRSAELVATRREGAMVHYRLASSHVGDLVYEAFAHAEHERLGLLESEAHS